MGQYKYNACFLAFADLFTAFSEMIVLTASHCLHGKTSYNATAPFVVPQSALFWFVFLQPHNLTVIDQICGCPDRRLLRTCLVGNWPFLSLERSSQSLLMHIDLPLICL